MAEALQVASFLACIALVVLVACVIPILFQARRQLEHLTLAVQESKAKLDLLADDSQVLVRHVSHLAKRANQQLDGMDHVVQTVERWVGRADQLVNEVGLAIEPPVLSAVHKMSLVRAGMNGFMQVLLRGNHSN